uniref:Uncharacterized protein n=1 Tax=Arundo donax TaxID=35708 RepID=A0A0A9E537_ARUDO
MYMPHQWHQPFLSCQFCEHSLQHQWGSRN